MPQNMWINGEFVSGSSDSTIEILNPFTERVIDSVPSGTASDVDRAVEAAQAAFAEWPVFAGTTRPLTWYCLSNGCTRSKISVRIISLANATPQARH